MRQVSFFRRHAAAVAERAPFAASARRALTTAAQAKNDPSKQRLVIFDTTLRDGEQSPG